MAVLSRLVQGSDGTYPSRPVDGYVDFLGSADPGGLMQVGDTWTQIPSPPGGGVASVPRPAVVSFSAWTISVMCRRRMY